MRKSYKLLNHEHCNASVEIHFGENGEPIAIELWSYDTRVCGWNRTPDGKSIVFCTGTYSQTTRRQISWFSRQPWQPGRDWKLSYKFFKEISEKCPDSMRTATDDEVNCIHDLIWQYIQGGKASGVYR